MLLRSSRCCRQWKEVGAIFAQPSRGDLLKCCDSFLHDSKNHNLEALRRHNVNFIALLNLEGIVRTIQLSITTASSSTQPPSLQYIKDHMSTMQCGRIECFLSSCVQEGKYPIQIHPWVGYAGFQATYIKYFLISLFLL